MTADSPLVSACVVNFNGEQYLPRCLSELQQAHGIDEIVVIDDASTDRSVQLVRDCFPLVRVVERTRNCGPGASRNAGFTEARHDRVLFVDNDVYVAAQVPLLLSRALDEHESAALAVARLVYSSAPHLVQFDGAESHFLGAQTLLHADQPLGTAPVEVRISDTSMISACFLTDRRRWGDEAPFDEAFFMFFEDHDFGFRCRALGFTIVSVPRAQCLHDGGTPGISLRQMGTYSPVRVEGLIRNRWQVLLKNYQLRTLFVLAPLLVLYELAQLAMAARKGWLRGWSMSVLWMLRRLPDVYRRRRQVQRRRTVPDRAVLRGGPLPFTTRLSTSAAQRVAQRWLDAIALGYWRVARRLI